MGSQLLAPFAGPWTGWGIAGETVGSSPPMQSVARASIPDRDMRWSPGSGAVREGTESAHGCSGSLDRGGRGENRSGGQGDRPWFAGQSGNRREIPGEK